MPGREQSIRATDHKFIKFKLKRIKQHKKRGNHNIAHRHAVELLQYLGIGNDEMPIDELVIETAKAEGETDSAPFRNRINSFMRKQNGDKNG